MKQTADITALQERHLDMMVKLPLTLTTQRKRSGYSMSRRRSFQRRKIGWRMRFLPRRSRRRGKRRRTRSGSSVRP